MSNLPSLYIFIFSKNKIKNNFEKKEKYHNLKQYMKKNITIFIEKIINNVNITKCPMKKIFWQKKYKIKILD